MERSNIYNGYYFESDSETGGNDDWIRSFYSIYNPFGVVIAEAKTELDAEMICVAMNATSASLMKVMIELNRALKESSWDFDALERLQKQLNPSKNERNESI